MKSVCTAITIFVAIAAATVAQAHDARDPLTKPIPPASENWMQPQAPLRLFGPVYYVGSAGLSVVLIDTGEGLVLIDAALPQNVETIKANVRAQGFRIEDIRYILNTEAHFDHAGGLAALARDTGAVVLTSPNAAQALLRGQVNADDPQATDIYGFAPVTRLRTIADGEVITLGSMGFTAVFPPGHTLGSTSWTRRACEGGSCKNFVFASSLNAYATVPYTYSGQPEVVARLRASIEKVRTLDCDVLIPAHPDNADLPQKLAALKAGDSGPLYAAGACGLYADRATARLDARLARETAR
jgi:metallo-beta-lactamase class B